MRARTMIGCLLALLPFAFSSGMAAPEAIPATSLPQVFDSLGQRVGITDISNVFSDSSFLVIARREAGRVLYFNADAGNYVFGAVYDHATADCSDPRYLHDESLFSHLAVSRDPLTGGLITEYAGDDRQVLDVRSQEVTSPTTCSNGFLLPSGFCCVPFAIGEREERLAVPITLPVFVPPFRIR